MGAPNYSELAGLPKEWEYPPGYVPPLGLDPKYDPNSVALFDPRFSPDPPALTPSPFDDLAAQGRNILPTLDWWKDMANLHVRSKTPGYIKKDKSQSLGGGEEADPYPDIGDDMGALLDVKRKSLERTGPSWGDQHGVGGPEYQQLYDQWAAGGRPRKGGIIGAREQQQCRVALQGPVHGVPESPTMDWGPVMDSVKETGGYTVGDAGESPTSGYMISQPNTEERRPTDTVTPHTEDDYHKRHWNEQFADPDLYQGGWDDKGTFYTDLSRNDQDLYRSIGDAVTTDQLGIYDLNRGQTLDTYDSPETDRDDYNPLLVSPGPIASSIARSHDNALCNECGKRIKGDLSDDNPKSVWFDDDLQESDNHHDHWPEEFAFRHAGIDTWPAKTTQERRDMWHNLGKNMLADAEQNGFDDTPGSQSISPGRAFNAAMREFEAGPLSYQGPDEESTVPSPPIDLPERKRRSLERKFKQPTKESLDPNMLDDRIDMDTLIRNALSRYHGATPEQHAIGKNWYATARARAEELARRTGGDFSKAAAIIAAMSPQMEWEGNLNAAAHFLNTYNPAAKHDWRRPNLNPQALQAWNKLTGGRTPQTPEDFATLAKLNGTDTDADWVKEMAMPDRWGRAAGMAGNGRYKYRGPYTGTGLPTLGDNVLRAMQVYDSQDPRQILDYAKGGPKIHSFWRNFLGDEDYVTIDKHMLRALDRGFGQDPLLSYGSGKPETTRVVTPEDRRVNKLEADLGLSRSMKGDEQQSVPTGYNTYAEAIRRATRAANEGKDPSEHVTPAQMQAIIWIQHKDDMDAFRKRKSQEAWEQANPSKTYRPPGPSNYVPAVPTNGPAPDYYQSDDWAQANPYKGDVPRPLVPDFKGPAMRSDMIPDPQLGPQEMSVMTPAPWAKPEWSQPAMPKAAGRWGARRERLHKSAADLGTVDVFADSDGTGVWRIALDRRSGEKLCEFLPAPHRELR